MTGTEQTDLIKNNIHNDLTGIRQNLIFFFFFSKWRVNCSELVQWSLIYWLCRNSFWLRVLVNKKINTALSVVEKTWTQLIDYNRETCEEYNLNFCKRGFFIFFLDTERKTRLWGSSVSDWGACGGSASQSHLHSAVSPDTLRSHCYFTSLCQQVAPVCALALGCFLLSLFLLGQVCSVGTLHRK